MSFLTQAQRVRVGKRIRLARLTSNFPSHDSLARQVGTSRQHLIKLEKGQHLPGEALLARIAQATGRDIDYFAAESDDDEEPDPVALMQKMLDRAAEKAFEKRFAELLVKAHAS
jgi:transcriptional regulator with XRE-family HTH domain